MASPFPLLRLPLLRLRLHHHHHRFIIGTFSRRPLCSAAEPEEESKAEVIPNHHQQNNNSIKWEGPEYRKWREKEDEILKDVESLTLLVKQILHSDRYMNGERLTIADENTVLEKLLAYHPHSEDKIGCGFDAIMVDRHPQFRQSRCLFVIRTDGGWIDFSYQKCLREYIKHKYPAHAERFIKEHFKRGSS